MRVSKFIFITVLLISLFLQTRTLKFLKKVLKAFLVIIVKLIFQLLTKKSLIRIVTCDTLVPAGGDLEEEGLDIKLPRGWYRIGTMQVRHDSSWFNLYRRRATGFGYWDFYTNIPERNCAG